MISIRQLRTLDEFADAKELYDRTFGPDAAGSTVNVEFLKVLSKIESYVGGAFDGDELVGFAAGLFGSPAARSLHSHVAAVSEEVRGQSIGYALKVDQRAWALGRGITSITWTYDPLVSRNAYFNLVKLAAQPLEYLPNFYGPLDDAINGSEESDRILVTWDLRDPVVARVCQDPGGFRGKRGKAHRAVPILQVGPGGEPVHVESGSRRVAVSIPTDVESLRSGDPALSNAWRLAVREALGQELDLGAQILDFDKQGTYILVRPEAQ